MSVLRYLSAVLLCICALLLSVGAARAQSKAGESTSTTPRISNDDSPIKIGIDGVYRPGQWTAIRLEGSTSDQCSVHTLDGDGVNVVYEQPRSSTSPWLYAIPGTTGVPLVVSDGEGSDLHRGRFVGKSIEPKMIWVVAIGDTLGLEEIGRNDLIGRESSVAVSVIRSAVDFPDQALGLSGVDLLLLGPSSIELLSKLDATQGRAVVRWIRQGGRLLISVGKNSAGIFKAAPWLTEVLPLEKDLSTIRLDPSAIETFTSSQVRLPNLEAAEFPARGGETLINGRNAARQPARVAVEYSAGFGRVIAMAIALDSVELAAWPQRSLLVTRLAGKLFESELDNRRDARSKSLTGYDDLAGQVRSSLDRFEHKRRIPYSVISVILLVLAGLIGPIDYFVVNRVLGRPLLGWITFPLTILLISSLLIMVGGPATSEPIALPAKTRDIALEAVPSKTLINRIEILDVDTTTKESLGRGWSWAHLTSLDAAKSAYPASLSPELLASPSSSSTVSAPFGYAGTTFGGISIAGEDKRLPSYQVRLTLNEVNALSSQVENIPLAPGGSKGVVTRWTFEPKLAGQSTLARRRGSELLEGSLTNPLAVDILNGALVFGEWVYLLPTRFRAGETIEDVEVLRQKNFRWLLSRREALENSSRAEPWNVEMYQDMPRLAEMLMFDSVAGGRDYTGLSNRPLTDLDLSYMLNNRTAIVYGQLASPALEIDLPVQRASVSAVRVILNVSLPRLASTSQ